MNKKMITFTVINFCTCLSLIVWFLTAKVDNVVKAYQVPSPFLGLLYYGSNTTLKIFDHHYPLFGSIGDDGNTWTMHYDGSTWTDDGSYYSYDQHTGIDYGLHYEPVLAAASGDVTRAEWANPSDHQDSYGLHVRISPDNGPGYQLIYGHLSVLTVKMGDEVNFDPVNREGIIGVSGNTGSVLGICPPVYENPLCGSHLHFEVRRTSGNRPVNPYGWAGGVGTVDPWSIYVDPQGTPGATSYDLWLEYPARPASPSQFPGGTPTPAPAAPVAVRTIDNSDSEYSTIPSGCMEENTNGGINGSYDYTITMGPSFDYDDSCTAKWNITPNSLTPADFYDVYVHIPGNLDPGALGAIYEIHHSGQVSRAVVVQAAYPNSDHPDHWVYIGRYEFTMDGEGSEYIRMNNGTIADDTAHFIAADAIQLALVGGPAVTPTPTSLAAITPSPTPQMTIPVTQSSDDAGPRGAVPTPCSTSDIRYATNWNEVYIGHCYDGTSIVSGLRFSNVAIPPGAVITKAQIEFTVDGPYEDFTTNVQFRGELTPHSSTFDNIVRPDNRPLTQATVLWNIPTTDDWYVDQKRYSPNLKNIIQEIVNQPGWLSGNALTIIVQPQPGIPPNDHRRVFAIDREGIVEAAKLQIWYTTPANTGFKNPSANLAESTGDGNGFEVNAVQAYTNNGAFAVDNNSGTSTAASCTDITKDRHRYYNFSGFSIPTGATITGIEVRLDAKVDSTVGSPHICVLLSRDGGSTWTAPKETPSLVTTEQSYILGGPTDKWGIIWIPGSFSSANFRVRIVNVASSTMRDFSLDWVAVKVYYIP